MFDGAFSDLLYDLLQISNKKFLATLLTIGAILIYSVVNWLIKIGPTVRS